MSVSEESKVAEEISCKTVKPAENEGKTKQEAELEVAKKVIDYCCKSVKPAENCRTEGKTKQEAIEQLLTEFKALSEKTDDKFQHVQDVLNDSIHGTIEFSALEGAIIDSLEFSRLKDIKQLGGKFHVYHGATHTRFQHSIGVCYLAGEFAEHLRKHLRNEEKELITDKDVLCLRLAGLCHDLGHGPFSHLFEEVTRKVLNNEELHHETLSLLLFKKILLDNPRVLYLFVESGMSVDEVKMIEKMIVPTLPEPEVPGEKKFLYEIVANKRSGMDVDKWDYFARDYLHLGVTHEFDWRRCMKLSSIVSVGGEHHIGFRDKEVTNMYGMFRTRSILYLKALRHRKVEEVETMLTDILIKAKDVEYTTDHGNTTSLQEALKEAYKKPPVDLTGYIALTDSFLHLIRHYPAADRQQSHHEAQALIDRLRRRKLYTMECEDVLQFQEGYDKPGEKEYIDRQKKEMNRIIKEHNKKIEHNGEIKLVCLKLSSEKSYLNPVDGMYFFKKVTWSQRDQLEQEKRSLEQERPSIPPGEGQKDEKEQERLFIPPGYTEGQKDKKGEILIKAASSICKPEKYIEFRLRLLIKDEDDVKKITDIYRDCHDEIVALMKQKII